MKCKFCNAQMDEEHKFCPYCGKSQDDPVQDAEPEQAAVTVEETPQIEQDSAVVAEQPLPEEKPRKKVWPLVLSIAAAVLALAALSVVLLIALGFDFKSLLPRANDIFAKDSYTVSDKKAVKAGENAVATMGDKQLTNAQLQIFYRSQVYDFLNYYGSYLSTLGLDISAPLSEQTCYFDETMSWEQYFLDIALKTWQNHQAIELMATEEGFSLDEEWQTSLDQLPEALAEQATADGFESVDAMVKKAIGPACTEQIYLDYIYISYLNNCYYISAQEKMMPTEAEIEAYFTEHAAKFAESGITKESGNVANVRHILIAPEGTTDETTGQTTYDDAQLASAFVEAERILDEWKTGEATQESFAELAKKYTADTASAESGGLYEGIAPGSNYVKEFLDWSVDMNRKPGDTAIVKTEFGYHIMYYVTGEPHWFAEAGTQLLAERITEMTETAEGKWPMKVNYRKIALSDLGLS